MVGNAPTFNWNTGSVGPPGRPNTIALMTEPYFRSVANHRNFHKHPRLPGHDYTRGSYFITICTDPRIPWFGHVVGSGPDAVMEPNDLGHIVLDDWILLPQRLPYVRLDQVQLMPDHFHAIIVLDGSMSTRRADAASGATADRVRPNGPLPGSLGAIIGAFKSGTTIRMNRLRNTPGHRYWQKGFNDWRIRPTRAGQFERIAKYIADNPKNWR